MIHTVAVLKIIDVRDPRSLKPVPDKTITLMSTGSFTVNGYSIKKIHLNQYLGKNDPNLGPHSLITVYVETDKGSIEMTYDEGYRGTDALEDAATFLTSHLGLSSLVLRSVIQLESCQKR